MRAGESDPHPPGRVLIMKPWPYENDVAVSQAAGSMADAARGITGSSSPAQVLAVLILSSRIDGWDWTSALSYAKVVADTIEPRLVRL